MPWCSAKYSVDVSKQCHPPPPPPQLDQKCDTVNVAKSRQSNLVPAHAFIDTIHSTYIRQRCKSMGPIKVVSLPLLLEIAWLDWLALLLASCGSRRNVWTAMQYQ